MVFMFTDKFEYGFILKNASERDILPDVTYTRKFSENEYFLICVKSGKAQIVIDNILYKISDEFLVLCSNTSVKYRFSKHTEIDAVTLHFSGKNTLLPEKVYRYGKSKRIENLLSEIIREFIFKDENYEESCSSLLTNLLIDLKRSCDKKTDVQKIINELVLDIHKNYIGENINVSSYAERANLSKDRLSVIFKESFGLAPYKYQLMLKMQAATKLLTYTDLSVKEIATRLGYENPLYFSTAYKNQTGESPTKARKRALVK